MRPPPFEPLPADAHSLRLRAGRDALILAGWLTVAFMFVVVMPLASSLGYDGHAYWSVDLTDIYGRAMESNWALGGFRYTPPIAFLFAPAEVLPWWLWVWLYGALLVGTMTWLGGRWTLVVLALPPMALELYHQNVHLLMAASIALGLRYPWAWSFAILAKVTPGVGLIWFAVRREWRNLAIALGATLAFIAVTFAFAPDAWAEWWTQIVAFSNRPAPFTAPFLPLRIGGAALLVGWGARTDRPWTVAVAATLALPSLSPLGVILALGAIPFLRRGDRAALAPDWTTAVSLRRYVLVIGAFIGIALVLALIGSGPIRQLIDDSSTQIHQ